MKKIKAIIFILFLIFVQHSTGQAIKILTPKLGSSNDYTKKEQILWAKAVAQSDSLNKNDLKDYDSLSDSDKKNIDSLEDGYGPCPIGGGDGWYNAGGPHKTTSTSYLNSKTDSISFSPNNLSDNNLLTAWCPDTKKGFAGQKINFYFAPFSPRVDEVIIYNGYIKNKELWKENARVKKLKLYINGKPFAILNLMDVTAAQSFLTDTFQSTDSSKDLILTFEILDVYKGSKFKDAAISEVQFNGLDVLCLGSGTKILMADQTEKNIESICPGDSVMTLNEEHNSYKRTIVTKLIKARHSHLVRLVYNNMEVVSTDDHPFLTKNKKWASVNPWKSNTNYYQEAPVKQLQVGDTIQVFGKDSFVKIQKINEVTPNAEQLTYMLELKDGNNFIANHLIAKAEKVCALSLYR